MGKPPMLDSEESSLGAEPADACRGIMGTGVELTGRTLATGFSSEQGGGRLSRVFFLSSRLYLLLFKSIFFFLVQL